MEDTAMTPEMVIAELDRIPPPTLAKLKRKLGMTGWDPEAMTLGEQTRLLRLFRRGTTRQREVPGPNPVPPAQQQALPPLLPAAGQNAQQMHGPPPHAGPLMHPPVPPNAHNPMLGDGFAPPHMPAIPMQYPNAMTTAGMQLGQGTANPRIYQNTLPHTMPARAPPRSSNQPQDPMIAPFAEDLDPEISSMALHTNLQAVTEASVSGLNINAIQAAWLADQSGRRETPR